MRLPDFILEPLAAWLIGRLRAGKGAPHKYGDIANAKGELYMERRWLVQPHWWTFGCGARIHRTARSDQDRDLHDHPWWNVSVILRGWYYEEMPATDVPEGVWFTNFEGDSTEIVTSLRRMRGDVVFRRAAARHRLIIPAGGECFSLFIMGPFEQVWGFYTRVGKIEWRTYLGLPPKETGATH